MPIISIITVNLNNLSGLIKTIKSVTDQRFKDLEFLIIDGGSIDGSIEVIQNLVQISPACKYLSEPDNGIYQAMNKGIGMSGGKYLLFLNSGDALANENVLENVFRDKHEAGFLLGRCNITVNDQLIHTTSLPARITFNHLYRNGIAHQATFIRRDLFLQFGLYHASCYSEINHYI